MIILDKVVFVNGIKYEVIKLLGKGKGGYSYLVKSNDKYFVLKQIHHEPCDYYQFGDKIASELADYKRLIETGIHMPKMIDIDIKNEIIIKEYIDGDTIFDLVLKDLMKPEYIIQVKDMAKKVSSFGLNIDYYPTNFVVMNGLLYYIDYECNTYSEEWNLENWGIKYWMK